MLLDVDGHALHVVDMGRGPALVMHGGWTGSWELWEDVVGRLCAHWRCVAYDHRGTGASTFPASSITAQALVDDLLVVIERLGIGRCVLAGESLGALTCLAAAAQRPDLVAGVVLVDGAGAVGPDTVGALVAGSRVDHAATVSGFVDACLPGEGREHLRRWGRDMLGRADPEAAARLFECHYGVEPPYASVVAPVLLIHVDGDAVSPVSTAHRALQGLSDAELLVLAGSEHVPTVTRPAEVADAIEEWARRRHLLPG